MTELSPLRSGRITGSRVAGVLDLSPYQSPDSVLRDMVRQWFGAEDEFTGNSATEHGHTYEPYALASLAMEQGNIFIDTAQVTVVHPTIPWLAATPDGFIDGDGLAEVKAPWKASYSSILDRPDYMAQIQLQLACTERSYCLFTIWRHTGFTVERVDADPWWLESNWDVIEAFHDRFEATIASDALSAPFLEPLVDVRTDTAWADAELELAEARADLRAVKLREDAAKERLIVLAGAKNKVRGRLVTFNRSSRVGAVDYTALLAEHAPGLDVKPYRKESTTVVTVKEIR